MFEPIVPGCERRKKRGLKRGARCDVHLRRRCAVAHLSRGDYELHPTASAAHIHRARLSFSANAKLFAAQFSFYAPNCWPFRCMHPICAMRNFSLHCVWPAAGRSKRKCYANEKHVQRPFEFYCGEHAFQSSSSEGAVRLKKSINMISWTQYALCELQSREASNLCARKKIEQNELKSKNETFYTPTKSSDGNLPAGEFHERSTSVSLSLAWLCTFTHSIRYRIEW